MQSSITFRRENISFHMQTTHFHIFTCLQLNPLGLKPSCWPCVSSDFQSTHMYLRDIQLPRDHQRLQSSHQLINVSCLILITFSHQSSENACTETIQTKAALCQPTKPETPFSSLKQMIFSKFQYTITHLNTHVIQCYRR